MQMDTVLSEGLHFRIPWIQYPIIYDIRARPRKISSLTGSKGQTEFTACRGYLSVTWWPRPSPGGPAHKASPALWSD
ncbi:Prohibitin-2 [Liparis tanakae]|uniref:Prohibitin n=1 Tax=Liparis tanakae TaxID=230148 RepID=A0A4Z2EW97_9TELE|nr:Prohibitin-2 [Liparis tanakae]